MSSAGTGRIRAVVRMLMLMRYPVLAVGKRWGRRHGQETYSAHICLAIPLILAFVVARQVSHNGLSLFAVQASVGRQENATWTRTPQNTGNDEPPGLPLL
jgi:hypothetical protein